MSDKARAEGYTLQERTSNTAIETLAEIAKQGVVIQQSMVETVRELGRTMNDNASQMRGMILMQETHSKGLRDVVENVDEVSSVIPKIDDKLGAINAVTATLETDIGESISQQFGPIVIALTEIGAKLSELVNAVSAKDNEINARLTILITDFHSAETRLMKALEPIVLKHIKDFLPADMAAESPANGSAAAEHNAPINIPIDPLQE